MSLPAEVGLCTIRGRYLSTMLKGGEQEGGPLGGLTVTFTPTIRPPMLKGTTSTPPVSILVHPVTIRTNMDGVLVGDNGETDTELIASDYPDPEHPWTYRVNIVGPGFAPQEFSIVAPTGAVLDLTEVLEAPSGAGFDLSAWSALVVRVEAARNEATTARDEAVAAAASVPTPAELNATYGGLLKTATNANPLLNPKRTNGAAVDPTTVIGYDPIMGYLFGADRPSDGLSMSSNGLTWVTGRGPARGLPPDANHTQLLKVVRFGQMLYLLSIDSVSKRARVYSSPLPTAANSTMVWTLTSGAMSQSTSAAGPNWESLNGKSTIFNAGSSAMMLGDYGDFVGGPRIQRSLDGQTWTTVWGPTPASRHIHCVAEDPYHPGHWYATVGDGAANATGVIRSTDNGDTWSVIVSAPNGNQWQSVQISFSPEYVYLAADRYGSDAYYFDRDELVVRHLSTSSHANIAVPGGVGARRISDLVTTVGSKVVTSASFTDYDRGREIESPNLPATGGVSAATEPMWIESASAGTATVRAAATVSGTTTAFIGGDRFYVGCYLGAVDPDTGVFYFAAMDTSSAGNRFGIFYVIRPGAPVELLGALPDSFGAVGEFFIAGGFVNTGAYRFPTITLG